MEALCILIEVRALKNFMEVNMNKFVIYTKWYWPNGITTLENGEKNMKEFSDKHIQMTFYGRKQMIIITDL